MVSVTTFRKIGKDIRAPSVEEMDPILALANLAFYEIGLGGTVDRIDERDKLVSITIETKILHFIDTSIFEGTADEMAPSLSFVRMMLGVGENRKTPVIDEILEGVGTYALLGRDTTLNIAVMSAAGVNDPRDVKLGLKHGRDKIIAALQRSRTDRTFREALSL